MAGLTIPVLALLYCRWWLWEGGWCWGPRFLLPGVLVALLPLGLLDLQRRAPPARMAAIGLLTASALVACSAMTVNFHDYHQWVKRFAEDHAAELAARGIDHYYYLIRWDWRFAPLLAYVRFPVRDYLLLGSALERPGVVLALFSLATIALIWGLLGLLRALRSGA